MDRLPRNPLRASVGRLAVALHAAALLAALLVPAAAVIDALAAAGGTDGAGSFAQLAGLRNWGRLLLTTAVVCGVAAATALSIGGVLALLMARTDLPGRRALLALLLLLACLPAYVTTIFVLARFPALLLSQSAVQCGLVHGLAYTPLAALVLALALATVDRELEDAALLTARPWRVLLRVTVPQAAWGAVTALLLIVLLVGTDFTIADVMGVPTFAREAYAQYQLDNRRVGPLLTALPTLAVLLPLLLAAQVRLGLLGEHTLSAAGAPRRFRLGAGRPWVAAVCWLAVLGGASLLAAAVVAKLAPLEGLGRVVRALLCDEIASSALLGAAGGVACVLPAPGLAWVLVRGPRPLLRRGLAAALMLLLATPAPVIGLSLIALLNRPGLAGRVYDSPLAVVIGYYVRWLPVAVLLLVPAMQRISHDLERAARADGADWLGEHWHVRLPAAWPDLLLALLVVALLCFGEVSTTMLVAPPGTPLAAVRAFTLLHFGVYRDLAVLALLSTACILLPWAGLAALLARRTYGWRGN